MNRIFNKFESLKSYFLSVQNWSDERFQHLHRWFSNGLLEPGLMFQTNAIWMFSSFNLASLQLWHATLAFELDLHDDQLFKQHITTFLGMTTRATIYRLLNYGAISDNNHYKFYEIVHYYVKESLSYIQKNYSLVTQCVMRITSFSINTSNRRDRACYIQPGSSATPSV